MRFKFLLVTVLALASTGMARADTLVVVNKTGRQSTLTVINKCGPAVPRIARPFARVITGRGTTAQTAAVRVTTPGSSGVIVQGATTTPAPLTGLNGGITTLGGSGGCANGNCPSPTTGRFFRR